MVDLSEKCWPGNGGGRSNLARRDCWIRWLNRQHESNYGNLHEKRLISKVYIEELIYPITIALVKLSILSFYLRIFNKKSFRIKCYLMIAFCAASVIAFTFSTAFQCSPIPFVWDKSVKGGKCTNFNAASWANAGLNILQDVLVVLLPIPELRKLKLNFAKKIGLYAMFGLGSFVCIVSIIRLYSLRKFDLTADPTWDNVPTTYWSCVKTTAAVVCACLPTIRAGFNRLYPKVWETTSKIWTPKPRVTMAISATVMVGYLSSANRLSYKEWPAQELNSMSTLSENDEESQGIANKDDLPPGCVKVIIRHQPDLMKPLPTITPRQDLHRSVGGFSMNSEP